MGRQTIVLVSHLYDVDHDEECTLIVDPAFVKAMESKYKIEYCWRFDPEDGEIVFDDRTGLNRMYGEPIDHIRALLETAKVHNRRFHGTFAYDDDCTGGSEHALVYVALNCTAVMMIANTDVRLETIDNVKNPTRVVVTL